MGDRHGLNKNGQVMRFILVRVVGMLVSFPGNGFNDKVGYHPLSRPDAHLSLSRLTKELGISNRANLSYEQDI